MHLLIAIIAKELVTIQMATVAEVLQKIEIRVFTVMFKGQ